MPGPRNRIGRANEQKLAVIVEFLAVFLIYQQNGISGWLLYNSLYENKVW
jgi:hypothetical protein